MEQWLLSTRDKFKKTAKNLSDGFFCQIDHEKHDYADGWFECKNCGRYICLDCYSQLESVKKTTCPHCNGELFYN